MRKILLGVIIALAVLFTFKYCESKKQESIVLKESSALIQEQIKNVGKLVVTEGHFSEVFNYKSSKEIFGQYYTSDKKALVVVNADVTIAFDLSKIEYEIDEANKILIIKSIPKEEIKISPDLEYYDIQADFFNPFEAKDYNDIKETIKASLVKKLEDSDLKANAKNRLISELSKFYILTNSLGWTLQYNETPILKPEAFNTLKL
ncbi:DUF4230 domain-containing protein [Oceanihabitans sediminis]|uniref:DUF4230 domain-containing protein n=1 Tax=Oceanihabitans sediminis TaxID=1812012 RepID=A0A368P7I0_9FLAO|nr:DUF4230 domain-containing protein [Oceanihabitans sediminis]MDX1278516.1 DUF4230 domain-containing protein [Oceanihabitans sediminis]MDX1772514.1 DUF4230 domain-containing protein [Oceanihabitans sediminis]RBP34163.1 uncharacterized protein DUF4230 [Oceanihabitans sediminis]RCU57855.1 DUF4230 domain-containing protein [Oceanihabitans sediminis]